MSLQWSLSHGNCRSCWRSLVAALEISFFFKLPASYIDPFNRSYRVCLSSHFVRTSWEKIFLSWSEFLVIMLYLLIFNVSRRLRSVHSLKFRSFLFFLKLYWVSLDFNTETNRDDYWAILFQVFNSFKQLVDEHVFLPDCFMLLTDLAFKIFMLVFKHHHRSLRYVVLVLTLHSGREATFGRIFLKSTLVPTSFLLETRVC